MAKKSKKDDVCTFVKLSFDSKPDHGEATKELKIINTLRGFPQGFPLVKYPFSEDVEKASPGIGKAQQKAHWSLFVQLKARVFLDRDGNARYEIIKPQNVQMELVDK